VKVASLQIRAPRSLASFTTLPVLGRARRGFRCDVDHDTAGDPRSPSAFRALDSRLYGETSGSEIDAHLDVGRVERDRRAARRTLNAELWRPAADELEVAHLLVVMKKAQVTVCS
jgi:hypothetical protein